MIVTDLEHAHNQIQQTPAFIKALAFLTRSDLATLPDGTIDIDGEHVYASVQSYETFPRGTRFKFEAHRTHIDIQYIVDGAETIAWVPTNLISFGTPYDPANDIQFGDAPAEAIVAVRLQRGQLVVLYPDDGHAPRHANPEPTSVKKILIKVAM